MNTEFASQRVILLQQLGIPNNYLRAQGEDEIKSKEVRSCRNVAAERINLIGTKADYTNGSARGNKKSSQESYRKYLDRQIRESVSFDNSLSIIGLAAEDRVHFTRDGKRTVDPEEQQKLRNQRQMKNELMKQMQEQLQRKLKEKQKKREEDQKEEDRIRKEQAELARRRELEEQQEKKKMPKYNQCVYTSIPQIITNKLSKSELKAVNSEATLKLVGTSIVKSSVRSSDSLVNKEVLGQATMITPVSNANSTRKLINHAKPSAVVIKSEVKSEGYSIAPNAAMKNVVRTTVETMKLIEEYQRQINVLRNENHLAKEEALLYKERLLRELEYSIQAKRLQPFIIKPTKRQPLKECTNTSKDLQLKKESEVNFPFEESLCSSSKKVPGIDLSKINEVMESSLCAETKLVAISNQPNDELYTTWKATEGNIFLMK